MCENLIFANLNKKASAHTYRWLTDLLQSERVPLVSPEPAALDQLTGLTDQVSYVAALDRLTSRQQEALVDYYAKQNGLAATEIEVLFAELGGYPVPADAVTSTSGSRR